MRSSNRARRVAGLVALVAAIAASACGGAASPPPATPPPPPPATPDPHLASPASVDDVFRLLDAAGLRITPTTATAGQRGEPVKRIVATYAEWPLVLTQFSSPEALRKAGKFDPRKKPGAGDAPYTIAGLNIMIQFGPETPKGSAPLTADEPKQQALLALIAALDPLLGPLAQRSVAPLPLPTLTPPPAAVVAPAPGS